MTTTTGFILVEHQHVDRDYGFQGTVAIVDHPKHGRLLVQDGFGGMDSLSGGQVRWRHGYVNQLLPDDTLEEIMELSTWELLTHGYDKERPILHWWEGRAIEAVAKAVGF